MIEKKTIVDQIEITRNLTVQIRFGLLLIEDGKEIDCKWHRTAVELGGDVDGQLTMVNAHLLQMSQSAIPPEDVNFVKSVFAVVAARP